MRQFNKFSGFFHQSNNGIFSGKTIRLGWPLGCLLVVILWPLLILFLLGMGIYFFIKSFFSRPRDLHRSAQAKAQDGIIDIEAVEIYSSDEPSQAHRLEKDEIDHQSTIIDVEAKPIKDNLPD